MSDIRDRPAEVNASVRELLGSIAPCYPDDYVGDDEKYITFDYSIGGVAAYDNQPRKALISLSVRYFCKLGQPSTHERAAITRALLGDEWSALTITNAADDRYQIYVWEVQRLWPGLM